MGSVSYSFCMSLVHSLWQAALLFLVYILIERGIRRHSPVFKRNLLYMLLLTQFVLSLVTFFFYYSGDTVFSEALAENYLRPLLPSLHSIQEFAPWLSTTYGAVIFFKTLHLAYRWRQFRTSCNNNLIKPGAELKVFTFIKASEFGIKRKLSIWLSDMISTPITFGHLKPVILLPVALVNQLTIAEVESLIVHELTHIKNNDYLLNLLLIISDTLFFFNPFVQLINNRIKLEREKSCDAQVLMFNYPAVGYAETLFKAAKFRNRPNVFQLAAVFKNRQLLRRIVFFTTASNLAFRKHNHGFLAFSAILMVMLINSLVMIQLNNRPANKPQTATESSSPLNLVAAASMLEQYAQHSFQPAVELITKKATDEIEKQLPELELKMANLQPMIQEVQDKAAELSLEIAEKSYALPASFIQENNTKELTVNEQGPNGHSVTKVYKMKLKNGVWEAQPLWMITETRSLTDSLSILRDSGLRVIPEVH